MIKNIMKNIGLKPVEVEEKEEVREDIDTDEFDSAGKKRPSTDVAYLKGWKDPQLKSDVIKAIKKYNATGNNLMNVLYNKGVLRKETEAEELYNKLDKMGVTNSEQFINQLAHDPEYNSEEK